MSEKTLNEELIEALRDENATLRAMVRNQSVALAWAKAAVEDRETIAEMPEPEDDSDEVTLPPGWAFDSAGLLASRTEDDGGDPTPPDRVEPQPEKPNLMRDLARQRGVV